MVAATGLSAHTLRYYEKEFLLHGVPRDTGGRRRYSDTHLGAVKFISALRATGMPINSIKQYIALYQKGDKTAKARMALLKAHEAKVEAELALTRRSLKLIREKISHYQAHLLDR